MVDTHPFACTCGAVRGELRDTSPRTGTRAVCHCSQCRAAEVYLDQPDPSPDGVNVFQTTCDKVHLIAGAENLRAFSFRKRGLIRWYAVCCKAPMFNVVRSPKMGFVSVIVDRLSAPESLGPPKTVAFRPTKNGRQGHKGLHHTIIGLLSRTARMRISGRWKVTPFFDASGQPTQPVHVLSKVEKSVLPLELRS